MFSKKNNSTWVVFMLMFVLMGDVFAETKTIYATRHKLRIYNNASDQAQALTPSSTAEQPVGMYSRISAAYYNSEILCDFDISVIPGDAVIQNVDFQYDVSYYPLSVTNNVGIYECNQNWTAPILYNDFSLNGWGDQFANQVCSSTGWNGWNNNGNLKTYINSWISNSSNNRGIVLTNNVNHTSEMKVRQIRLVIDYLIPYPTITSQPSDKSVNEGDGVTFNVTASDATTYKWRTNSSGPWTDIGTNQNSYSISQASLSNIGDYHVVVSNNNGSVISDTVSLSVCDTAFITTNPSPVTVLMNENATFSVVATGDNLSYSWYYRVNAGASSTLLNGENNSSVILSNVSATYDGWQCFCRVAACGEHTDSEWATLTVQYPVKITAISPASPHGINAGNTLDFSVTASGNPAPTYEWQKYKNTAWVAVSGASSSAYQIGSVAVTDDGRYRVRVYNIHKDTLSEEIVIQVFDKPVVTVEPRDTMVLDGVAVHFTVVATGEHLTYQWQEYSGTIDEDISGAISATYSFTASSSMDAKRYRCVISSGSISDTSYRARFTLGKIPVVTSNFLPDTVIPTGDVFSLNGSAAAVPAATYEWFLIPNGLTSPISVGTSKDFELTSVTKRDSGFIYFVATNKYSSKSSDTIFVNVLDPIRIDVDLPGTIMAIVGGKTVFSPDIAGDGVLSFQWYDNENAISGATDQIYTISLVDSANNHEHFYHCVASNSFNGITLGTVTTEKCQLLVGRYYNPLVLHGKYIDKTDSVKIIIDSIAKLNSNNDSVLVIETSKFSGFNPIFSTDSLKIDSLMNLNKLSDTLIVSNIGLLPLETTKMYCRWNIVGVNSAISRWEDTSFSVGWDRPVYGGTLVADTTGSSVKIHVSWDAPVGGFDSLRIWWDSDIIPLTHSPALLLNQAHSVRPPTKTVDTIGNLASDETYFLGLQILKDNLWSVITEKSRTSIKTIKGGTEVIENVAVIDSIWFDAITNKISVKWKIDQTKLPAGKDYYQLTHQVNFNKDSVISKKPLVGWFKADKAEDVIEISIKNGVVFDTLYYVGLWLRAIDFAGQTTLLAVPTSKCLDSIAIPTFNWEILSFFQGLDEVVTSVNGDIILKKLFPFFVEDTIWNCTIPNPLPKGLVDVGSPVFSFYPWSQQVAPFILGMKYGDLPNSITTDDLSIYQIKDGKFHVLHGSWEENGAVWNKVGNENLFYTFVVLADTLPPVVNEIINGPDILNHKDNCIVNFSIENNIENTRWKYLYGAGNSSYTCNDTGTTNLNMETILTYIEHYNNVISKSSGVRALFITDDGIHIDTINVSRQVSKDSASTFSTAANEWVPIRIKFELDNPALDVMFKSNMKHSSEWEYDTYKIRLYRWYSPKADTNCWLEYDDSVKSDFTFVPGRPIWCKTSENYEITIGSGVTTSLRNSYEIALKPKSWTDLTMPFDFQILLKDILINTGKDSDSISVHHWAKIDTAVGGYETIMLYEPKFHSVDEVTDTIESVMQHDAYTMYNYSYKSVKLKIPPISLALSTNHPTDRKTVRNDNLWHVSYKWKNISKNSNSIYRDVLCGYEACNSNMQSEYGPIPPTMSSIIVGVIDSMNDDRLCGWALQHDIDKGGLIFEILLKNNSKSKSTIEYFMDNIEDVPDNFKVKVLDPATMQYEECDIDKTARLSLLSGKESRRYVVVGSDDYFNNVLGWLAPFKFTLLKAFPNPFNNRIKIQYRLPKGIKEVRFTLYDMRGRIIWKSIERNRISRGLHVFDYDTRIGLHKKLSTGVYIMRLSAVNKAGKIVFGGEKRITCVK